MNEYKLHFLKRQEKGHFHVKKNIRIILLGNQLILDIFITWVILFAPVNRKVSLPFLKMDTFRKQL